jgi:transposase
MKGYDIMSRRKLEINKKHCTYAELETEYKQCQDPAMKTKILVILQTWDGFTSSEIAKILHKSDFYVRRWIHKYNENGLKGLQDTRGGNRVSYLSNEQKQAVTEALQKSPRECGFNRSNWTMPLLKIWINKQWRIIYKTASLYDVVHALGFTLQRPKKQSRNAKKEQKDKFKQELNELIENIDDDTVILYEDEAIITDEPTTTAKWALKGNQPIVATESSKSRERIVMFGAVNPKDGQVTYSTYDSGNSDNFKDFLK